jgi:hypothetical protein
MISCETNEIFRSLIPKKLKTFMGLKNTLSFHIRQVWDHRDKNNKKN